jgi:hypothetical protein
VVVVVTSVRLEDIRLEGARAGRRTLALVMAAALLLVGPMQSRSAAGTCAPSGGGVATRSLAGLVTESTGVPFGLNDTEIRWTRWHTRVVFGTRATLEGQVVTEDGAIPDAAVSLLARPAGSEEWETVGSATADSDTGVFSFTCLQPTRTTDYRAVYQGTILYTASEGRRKVQVARRVPDSMTQVAATRFRFQGSVEPRYAGRPLVLERKGCSSCRWSTVARTRTTSRSAWRFTIDVSGFTGDRWYRAVVPGDASYARSYSARTWRLSHR